jgi:hypothetical protein
MIGFLGVLVMVAGLVSTAAAWERGTHAFIAEQVRKGGGPNTVAAMYASTCPDCFNYMFTGQGALYRDYFYEVSHFQAGSVWDAAKTGHEKNAARGFASHNNVWGADKTAHAGSLTLLPNEGYVITKAKMVDGYLKQTVPAYAALMQNAPEVGLEICHSIVEAAGELILKNADPTLGPLLLSIAQKPCPEVPAVMVRAFADGLAAFSAGTAMPMNTAQAAAFILGAEAEWRQGMIAYGYLMQADDATFKANIVEQFKALAAGFLGGLGIELPAPEILQALIEGAFDLALYFCQADYMNEVLATAEMVRKAVKDNL